MKYFSKKILVYNGFGRGWIQGWTSCSEGCLASSLSYLLSWKPAVTIYLVVSVCAWALPAWGLNRSKKEQRPEEPPPQRLLEAQKIRGGVYFTWSGEIFLRNFLPYPPPNIPGLKGGINICISLFLSPLPSGCCQPISQFRKIMPCLLLVAQKQASW